MFIAGEQTTEHRDKTVPVSVSRASRDMLVGLRIGFS